MENGIGSSNSSVSSQLSFGDQADSHSDTEPLFGSRGVSTDTVPKDYWFGKKYFECVLAQDILCSTPAEESASSVDV